MDRERLSFLRSPRGGEAVARARQLGVGDRLATLTALRRAYPLEEAAAAVELALLRERAASRFSRSERMFFEREALEQASGERIAGWRARRFSGREVVADLCCGLGGDALALAEHTKVVAVDRDRLRLELLRENARVCGVSERIWLIQGCVPEAAPRVAVAFADPSRRAERGGESRRQRSLERMSPPLSTLLALTERIPDLGIKLSPALDGRELSALLGGRAHELEFISDGGECREAVLWLGGFITAGCRASVLPSGETRTTADAWEEGAETDSPPVGPPGAYLYDPDPAIVRAHLVDLLASELDAWKLDPRIAYLTSDRLISTPLATAFVVREAMTFQLQRLRTALASRGYGDVIIKKRGFPMEPESLRRQLLRALGSGGPTAVVLLARRARGHLAIIGERVS